MSWDGLAESESCRVWKMEERGMVGSQVTDRQQISHKCTGIQSGQPGDDEVQSAC